MMDKIKAKLREQTALVKQQYNINGEQFTQKVSLEMQQKVARCKKANSVKHCRDCPELTRRVFKCVISRYEKN